jgi:hypothetical protein
VKREAYFTRSDSRPVKCKAYFTGPNL